MRCCATGLPGEVVKHAIAPQGAVRGACRGTGPRRTPEDYLTRETPEDDPHGVAAVLFAAAARLVL